MTLGDVLDRLHAPRRAGKGWLAPCPAHDDPDPSLSIAERDGRVLLHCFAGCAYPAIVTALGFDATATRPPRILTPAEEARAGEIDALWAARRQPGRRREVRVLYALADAHRHALRRLAALQDAALRLPPELDATWAILAHAGAVEDEVRLLEAVLDRWWEVE